MPVLRKRATGDIKGTNGLYVHANPPRVLELSVAHIKHLIRNGDVDKLEHVVLEGQGKKLIGEQSTDYRTKMFLKTVPTLMSKISLLHDSVNSDRLEELQWLLNEDPEKRKKLVMAKDESGVGLLHKAVYYDLKHIYKWFIEKFPQMVNMKDSEGRTPYHYTLLCKDPAMVQKMLSNAGADPFLLDYRGHCIKYYANHLHELELPHSQRSSFASRKSTATEGRLNFKKSNIRIWIHQRNLTNLQQVVWEGHGPLLLVEHSNNAKVKKFLEAVPHIMGLVRDIHADAINDDQESLKNRVNPPVPAIVLSGKDSNGLTALHKAAGLGHQEIADFIIKKYPSSVNLTDCEGRTPLHYAALLKDDGKMMKFLLDNGADESALDNKQKTAAYYKTRHSEIDSKLLSIIPSCPRSAKEDFASNFDWSMLNAMSPVGDIPQKIENIIKNGTNENSSRTEPTEKQDKNIEPENGKAEDVKENAEGEKEIEIEEDNKENVVRDDNQNPPNDAKEENEEHINEDNHPPQEKDHEIIQDTELDIPINETNVENETRKSTAKIEEIKEPVVSTSLKENGIIDHPDSKEEEHSDETNRKQHKDSDDDNNNENIPKESENDNPQQENETQNETQNEYGGGSRTRPSSNIRAATSSKTPRSNSSRGEQTERLSRNLDVESEGVIEGIVNGEHEVEPMNNEGQNTNTDLGDDINDGDVHAMVENGNMEQLAAFVLNGDGQKLVGQRSDNPELQSFLDNVTVYMSKINRIHWAARTGNLRELQAALDRRKFAIAKDAISPNGASPLHVAVIFGNTSVVRYLAGRFPETVQVLDDNGRTPLHYAAVLNDNGHYYNLLMHLGADTRIQDKFGHTPEYYIKNQTDFSHRTLLNDFGADDEEVEKILKDNDSVTSTTENGQVDMPFFATEEGRYLASSLGDPLIKGLTEVANKRPEDPIAYLATYLYNFAATGTTSKTREKSQENHHQQLVEGSPQTINDNKAVPASIDVVTIEPDDNNVEEQTAFKNTSRDEHGQSMLHFAAARAHGRNALYQLLLETEINVGYRDELYRTARDISIQANIPENTVEIDRYILHIATKGDTDKLVELLLEGYDHITDVVDEDDQPITQAVSKEDQPETVSFLQSILAFEEKRERVHHAIRQGSIHDVTALLADENDTGSGKLLAIGKNSYGRCTLHIAVLCQQEEIVDYIANSFRDTLRIGDNLERTALHYAMGVEKMESISRVLIKAGAKRVVKDLKGRQPTYYFLNKSDILRLQEEEETF